ncbi:hypothetical protein [Metabacillus sp. SLBN-84]
MPNIIVTKGNADTPPRFWARAICEKHELTEDLIKDGWIETSSRLFLSEAQLARLGEPEGGE